VSTVRGSGDNVRKNPDFNICVRETFEDPSRQPFFPESAVVAVQ